MPPERSVQPTQIAQQKLNHTNTVYFVNWLVGLLVEEAWFSYTIGVYMEGTSILKILM
jgi:hypothetical protein